MSYLFIACTVLLTVYGQIVIKWQIGLRPEIATEGMNARSAALLLMNPWIISAFVAAFGASLFWMAALSKMPLSKVPRDQANPSTALSFPPSARLAALFFRESFDLHKLAGTALIIAGVVVLSRSGIS